MVIYLARRIKVVRPVIPGIARRGMRNPERMVQDRKLTLATEKPVALLGHYRPPEDHGMLPKQAAIFDLQPAAPNVLV
jgi:hypothetical protein